MSKTVTDVGHDCRNVDRALNHFAQRFCSGPTSSYVETRTSNNAASCGEPEAKLSVAIRSIMNRTDLQRKWFFDGHDYEITGTKGLSFIRLMGGFTSEKFFSLAGKDLEYARRSIALRHRKSILSFEDGELSSSFLQIT